MLKVGDKVKIKSAGGGCIPEMDKYVGQTTYVIMVGGSGSVRLHCAGIMWLWANSWLEKVED